METEEKRSSAENIAPTPALSNSTRAQMLKARYGQVEPGADSDDLFTYHLHFKCNPRAVNQGSCFLNVETNTYYVKSRRSNSTDQIPKEMIFLDLEMPTVRLGHSHINFYLTGMW